MEDQKELREGCDMEKLIQNMVDGGCSKEAIDGFITCMECGEHEEGLCLLEAQREGLLDKIHKDISCIAFLDEQLCRIRKENKEIL